MQLRMHLLGPPRFELDGQPIATERRKALALFIYLAITQHPHSRDMLAAFFWPDYERASAYAYLRRTLWELNQALGEGWLTIDREQVALHPDSALWIDAVEFRQHLAACASTPLNDACLARLAQAAALYQDDFLAGFGLRDSPAFEEWQFFQAEELRSKLAWALERLALAHEERGQANQGVGYARRWVSLDLLHEPAHRTLMRLYAAAGQRGAALRQYELCAQTLRQELGASPSAETTALYEQIRRADRASGAAPASSPRQPATPPAVLPLAAADLQAPEAVTPVAGLAEPLLAPLPAHNLHPSPTTFIGRVREVASLRDLILQPAPRLITLLGPGGVGKTRLALAVVDDILNESPQRFPDGVFFTPLVSITTAEYLPTAIADAADLRLETGRDPQRQQGLPSRTPRQQVVDFLRNKQLLLLLDNFEHLVDGTGDAGESGSELVSELLAEARGVKIVVTSRERLHLQEEQLFTVGGLALPDVTGDGAQSDAVQLFVQRARQVQPEFALGQHDLAAVVRICQQVGAMPLALELAASWADTLPVAAIADEMARSLDFLESDLRNLPPRHRSMRAIFDHTWRRLAPSEQTILARMSVLRGGFSREAAQAVAGVSLRQLANFCNRSLLHFRPAQDRYEIHELLRQYAAERLAQIPALDDAAHAAHAAYFCGFLCDQFDDLKGAHHQQALKAIEQILDNVQIAWHWAIDHDKVGLLAKAAAPLSLVYMLLGRYDDALRSFERAHAMLRQSLAGAPAADPARWRALVQVQVQEAPFAPDADTGKQLLAECLDLLRAEPLRDEDTRAEAALVYYQLGEMARPYGYASASEPYLQALELFRGLGDRWGSVITLNSLGWLDWGKGDYAKARVRAHEALEANQGLGNQLLQIDSYLLLSLANLWEGEIDAGELHLGKAMALLGQIDNPTPHAFVLTEKTQFDVARGNYVAAAADQRKLMALARDRGWVAVETNARVTLALEEIHLGNAQAATALLDEALAYFAVTVKHPHHMVGLAHQAHGMAALALGQTGAAMRHLERALVDQRAVGRDSDIAGSLAYLARAALERGDPGEAAVRLAEAIALARATHSVIPMLEALPTAVGVLTAAGFCEVALETAGLVAASPLLANSHLHGPFTEKAAALCRKTVDDAAAQTLIDRGRSRDLWQSADELLAFLASHSFTGSAPI